MVARPVTWGIGKLSERAVAAVAKASAAAAAREAVKERTAAGSRDADCSQMEDETACQTCALGSGWLGIPPTPRYITKGNRINYDYQLQIANLHASPEQFGYVKVGDSSSSIVNIDLSMIKEFFGSGGNYSTLEWMLGGVAFDGFWRSRCTVVEAKGRFGHFFDENGDGKKRFMDDIPVQWVQSFTKQRSVVQVTDPDGRLEWHFMDVSAYQAGKNAGIPEEVARLTPFAIGRIL